MANDVIHRNRPQKAEPFRMATMTTAQALYCSLVTPCDCNIRGNWLAHTRRDSNTNAGIRERMDPPVTPSLWRHDPSQFLSEKFFKTHMGCEFTHAIFPPKKKKSRFKTILASTNPQQFPNLHYKVTLVMFPLPTRPFGLFRSACCLSPLPLHSAGCLASPHGHQRWRCGLYSI